MALTTRTAQAHLTRSGFGSLNSLSPEYWKSSAVDTVRAENMRSLIFALEQDRAKVVERIIYSLCSVSNQGANPGVWTTDAALCRIAIVRGLTLQKALAFGTFDPLFTPDMVGSGSAAATGSDWGAVFNWNTADLVFNHFIVDTKPVGVLDLNLTLDSAPHCVIMTPVYDSKQLRPNTLNQPQSGWLQQGVYIGTIGDSNLPESVIRSCNVIGRFC